jgi:predicted nucleotidyltransferase
LDFERSAVESALDLEIGGISIRLPRVEDLIVMKAVAGRPKDLEDIRGLLDAHPEADCEEAQRWVREFATAASMPDLLSQFEKLLQERKI